jgi:propionyl-CoA synthetase
MKNVFDLHEGGVHFACSDIGWVVGHSFIVYGPLIRCSTTIFFEGKPIVPDAGVIWRVCQEYKVTSLYMAPTAVRVIKKEDYDGNLVKKYNTDSVRTFCLVGERCDPDTIHWIYRHFPKVLINDTWWQTETGWPISANILNLKDFKSVFPTLPGSVTRPVPGYDVQIFNEETNEPVENPGDLGKVVIKLPLPPAFMLTLWGNDEAFIEKYLADTPGYYTTGDAGIIDDKGYVHIMTRTDDVINTAGHRISTGRLEEVVNEYDPVVESAVVGFNHPIRGEVPVALVIMKAGIDYKSEASKAKYSKEINAKVRADVGAFCRLEGVLFAEKLPKTRSGKILRRTIREICNQQEYKMPATIDDETSIDHVKELSTGWYKTLDLTQ